MDKTKALKELMRQHKELHKDWEKNPSNETFQLHEQLVSLFELHNYIHKTPLRMKEIEKTGKIVFLGTRGEIEEKDKLHAKHSAILFTSERTPRTRFLIDWGEDWKWDKLPLGKEDPILISHAHKDHLYGLKGKLVRNPVYKSEATNKSEFWKDKFFFGLKKVEVWKRGSDFVLAGRKITSVPVLHSTKAPNAAFFFTFGGRRICYATDVLSIKKGDREKYLKGVDVYIGDGSSLSRTLIRWKGKPGVGEPYGHASVKRQLQWCKDAGVKMAVFTHWGKEAVEMKEEELIKKVFAIAREVGFEGRIGVARDNSELLLPDMIMVYDESSLEEIKDLTKYDPKKVMDDSVLRDDWRILLAWWSTHYAPGGDQKFKYPKELLFKKAVELAKEMNRRGMAFSSPKTYKGGARDLFVRVVKKIGAKKFNWLESFVFLPTLEGEVLPGRYLAEPHARKLWTGEKTLIVATKPYKKYADKKLYLIGDKCYGIGVHSMPKGPLPADDVRTALRDRHWITDEEWKKWWKDVKEVYIFTWKWIEKFDPPKEYVKVKGPQAYYKKVTLVESLKEGKADDMIRKLVDANKWAKLKVEDREKLMNKRDYLEPLYPFSPTKTSKKGYRELELFDRPSVALLVKTWFGEHPGESIYTEVKFDGMRVTGHKKGKKVAIYTEGGELICPILPNLREDLGKIRADSVILDAEIVPYDEEGVALGRRAAMKALGKKEVDDSRWIAHVFDCLYLEGEDLHKKTYEERRKALRGIELPRADYPKHWKWHWVENIPRISDKVEKTVSDTREVSDIKYSEGGMFKLSGSDYPITRRTALWAKYKKFFDLDVMVVHKFPKRYTKGPKKGQAIPGQNNFACVIGPVAPPKGVDVHDLKDVWKEERSMENYKDWKAHRIQYLKFKGKVWSNIGLSMSSAEEVKIGDIIRCTVRLIRKINDTEYHWLIPRVLEPRPEKTKPDPIATAATIAKASQYLVKKAKEKALVIVPSRMEFPKDNPDEEEIVLEKGEELYDLYILKEELKEMEVFHKEVLKEFIEEPIREALEQVDPYMILPDEGKKWEFDVQNQPRGLSCHIDHRNEISKEKLIGWTVLVIKSILPQMILRYSNEKDFMDALKDKKVLKGKSWREYLKSVKERPWELVDKLSGALDKKYKDELSKKTLDIPFKTMKELCAHHPKVIKEFFTDPNRKAFCVTKAPEPHEWLHARGRVEPGEVGATAELPGFFVGIDHGRVEFLAQKDYMHEYYWDGKVFNGKFIFRKLARTAKWRKVGRKRQLWLLWRTKEEDHPYVLKRRAVKKAWMPPDGKSALPEHIRKQIPDSLKYWKKKGKAARDTRDELRKAIKKKEVPIRTLKETLQESPLRFQLKRLWWKGPLVIRGVPQIFYAFILHNAEVKTGWHFDKNPLIILPQQGIELEPEDYRDGKLIKDTGAFEPLHPLNPNEELPLLYDTLDKGVAELIAEDKVGFYRLRLKGEKLKGLFVLMRQAPRSKMWMFKKSKLPKPKEVEELEEALTSEQWMKFIPDIIPKKKVPKRAKVDKAGWVYLKDKLIGWICKDGLFYDIRRKEYASVPPSGKVLGPKWRPQTILDSFDEPIMLQKGFIFMSNPDRETTGDADVFMKAPMAILNEEDYDHLTKGELIKAVEYYKNQLKIFDDWYNRATHFRLIRAIKGKHQDSVYRAHISNDFRGPFTSFTNIYDLVLVPSKQSMIVRMSKDKGEETSVPIGGENPMTQMWAAVLQYHSPEPESDFPPHYDLRIDDLSKPFLIHFVLWKNPIEGPTTGYAKSCYDREWMKKEGPVRMPDGKLCTVKTLQRGKAGIAVEKEGEYVVELNFPNWKGIYTFFKVDEGKWRWEKISERVQESFQWARGFDIQKEDEKGLWIKGRALFPTCSLNRRCYTKDEIIKMARTATGKPIMVNHGEPPYQELEIGTIVRAEEEDETLEFIGVITDRKWIQIIKRLKPEERLLSVCATPLGGVPRIGDKEYPEGLIIEEISIIISPEKPGVPQAGFDIAGEN